MRRRRVGMWTLGLTLVLLGGALLYRELTGISIDIGRYWPLAIVGLGIELLIAQTQVSAEGGGGVRVSGLAVVGLVILLLAAPLTGGPWGVSCSPVGPSCNGTNVGANQEFREDRGALQMDWTGVEALEVNIRFGSVDIRPVGVDEAPSVRLEVVGHGYTSASARRVAQAAELRHDREGGRLVLRGFNESVGNGSEHADLNLTLRVPSETILAVDDEFGPVSIDGIKAAVAVTTRFSPASVTGVTGEVSVTGEHGRVDVSRVTGPVTVRATYGGVSVTDVTGPVDVESKHGGVDLRDLQSGLVCRATYGRVSVTHAAGDVEIDSKHGNVDLRYPGGAVSVEATYGGVTVTYDVPVPAQCELENTYGGISLDLPKDSKIELDVSSQRTRITSNLEGIAVTAVGSGSTLKATYNGGGPLVGVSNDFGRVDIRGH